MNKKKTILLRVILLVGTITSLFFVPWLLVKAWILPLPDTVQKQLDEAIGHGFDGMIVYVFPISRMLRIFGQIQQKLMKKVLH